MGGWHRPRPPVTRPSAVADVCRRCAPLRCPAPRPGRRPNSPAGAGRAGGLVGRSSGGAPNIPPPEAVARPNAVPLAVAGSEVCGSRLWLLRIGTRHHDHRPRNPRRQRQAEHHRTASWLARPLRSTVRPKGRLRQAAGTDMWGVLAPPCLSQPAKVLLSSAGGRAQSPDDAAGIRIVPVAGLVEVPHARSR